MAANVLIRENTIGMAATFAVRRPVEDSHVFASGGIEPSPGIKVLTESMLGQTGKLDFEDLQSEKTHPGFVASRFGSQSGGLIQFISPVAKLLAVTPKQGAETIIYLATSPQVAGMTGLYFHKRKPINTSSAAQDDTAAVRLWAASEVIAALSRPSPKI